MSSERRKPPPHSFRPGSAAVKEKPRQQAEPRATAEARPVQPARGGRARKSSVTPQELEAMTRALDSLNADWDEFKSQQPMARRLSVLVGFQSDKLLVCCLSLWITHNPHLPFSLPEGHHENGLLVSPSQTLSASMD